MTFLFIFRRYLKEVQVCYSAPQHAGVSEVVLHNASSTEVRPAGASIAPRVTVSRTEDVIVSSSGAVMDGASGAPRVLGSSSEVDIGATSTRGIEDGRASCDTSAMDGVPCRSWPEDSAPGMLDRLASSLQRLARGGLFPYNIRPLLRRLDAAAAARGPPPPME